MSKVSLSINGRALSAEVEPRTHLADLLRETHNLTGTHIGCEHGVCGACTLIVDGAPIRACITFAVACENASVTTIEGLDEDEIARELRAAFTTHHALQCGYCTPGMIVSARDVVLRLEAPSEHDIRVAMSGNLCRCTGYVGIVRAIASVIADRRARGVAARPGGCRDRLGPVGSGHAGEARTALAGAAPAAAARAAPGAPADASHLEAEWKPQVEFRQSFVVAHPVEDVWAFLGRIEDVAACLPGAWLDGDGTDGAVKGAMRVKVGPISTEFRGTAHITRDAAAHRGAIVGAGRDARSNSATRGMIAYSVTPDAHGAGCRVDVDVGYTLTGMLAQFSRAGLVQDVANRLTGAFARNLEARLSAGNDGAGQLPAVRELNAGSLIAGVLFDKVRGFLGRFFGRS
ncbi:MAG TPA: 2Fe-2S iron-sulfur cluster-binding protein [Roseiarcus sp.]|nr:2Fe-2S iron-sulfur cluster-binding protein [Roseiarcus sp.]